MGQYIIRRVLWVFVLLFLVMALTFIIFTVLPSADPAQLRAGRQPSPELVEQIRKNFGLDKPKPVQFVNYLGDLMPVALFPKGCSFGLAFDRDSDKCLHYKSINMGFSFQNDAPVKQQIFDRLPVTFQLTAGAVVIWLVLGLSIGMISATRPRSPIDRMTMGGALVAISAPVYWLGLVCLYLFSNDIGKIHIFNGAGSYTGFSESPSDWFSSLILPWLVLAAAFSAFYARLLRGNLIEVMSEDYIRTARAKGLRERRVVWRHGMRSAITPIVTILGLDIGILLGGAILTESVFNIPGIGRLAYDSIARSDLPMIQGTVLFGAFFIVVMNLLVDVAYAFLDPPGPVLMADSATTDAATPGAPPPGAPLLEIRDLKVHFDTDDGLVKAVDGVSYTVERGQALGIVGESGSGKSVSSLTVLGLTRSASATISGEILFQGRNLLEASDDEMRGIRGDDIAMIFQDPLSSLHPFYKVGAQLIEAVRAHRDVSKAAALDRAVEMLGLVGIPEPRRRVDAYPHEFSGGMRQRAMIAMALANDPKLLIADEPTTALDVTVQAQILELIQRLQKELDTAVVIITHDLGVVAEVADEIAVMYAGRIVERAPTRTVFRGPEHPYTWGLLGSIPRLTSPRDVDIVPISGRPPSLINLPSGCSFHPRCPHVRDSHRRVEPTLEPLPDDPDHRVACLLDPATRKKLWRELQAGETPVAAREAISVEEDEA